MNTPSLREEITTDAQSRAREDDTYEQKTDPGLDAGDVVTVHGDRPVKRAL